MTDRELLELAAKAAGIELKWSGEMDVPPRMQPSWESWSPLTDDGDALRLAVKVELHVFGSRIGGSVNEDIFIDAWDCNNNPYAATRRAIVRAAAEIGKAY